MTIENTMSDLHELLRLHVEAVWNLRLPPLTSADVELTPVAAAPPWALYLGKLSDGDCVRVWRPDVPLAQRDPLITRAEAALALPIAESAPAGIVREVALRQIAAPRYTVDEARQLAQPLTPEHRALLAAFWPGDEDELLSRACAPLFGVISDDGTQLLSLAHSSRRTPSACELGVETRPIARRRGYALAVTILWADAVAREGLVPFYSALAANTASRATAEAAGYRIFAQGAQVTQ